MKIKTPDEFVHRQPDEYKPHIEKLRQVIKETIPVAEEIISFQVICYRYHYLLVGIGTSKGNISFYTMDSKISKNLKDELSNYKYTNSTIYFPISKELPVELIKEIIHERIIENEQKADLKNLKL